MVFVILLILVAILADVIAPYSITERDVGELPTGPSSDHWFGTDIIGRDVFSRVVYGSSGVAAHRHHLHLRRHDHRRVRRGLRRLRGSLARLARHADHRHLPGGPLHRPGDRASPPCSAAARTPSSSCSGSPGGCGISRIVRASFMQLSRVEYVEAARALGFKGRRIMFGHILPNALQPIIVYGTIAIGSAILAEAALSFLQVGPQDPTPAWGLMVSQGKGDLANAPHLVFFPGVGDCVDRARLRPRRRWPARRSRSEVEEPMSRAVKGEVLLSVKDLYAGLRHRREGAVAGGRRTSPSTSTAARCSRSSASRVGQVGHGDDDSRADPDVKVDRGEILWKGRDLLRGHEAEMRRIRGAEIAMIFQDPLTALNPVHTVGRQVAEMARIHRRPRRRSKP